MALFGMVWLLRVRSEMRRCSECRREELLVTQQQNHNVGRNEHRQQHQHQHQRPYHQHRSASQVTSLIHTPEDGLTMSSANTLFTLDTPGVSGPTGSYCEVHGYVAPKEGILLVVYILTFDFFFQQVSKDRFCQNKLLIFA